MAHFYASMKGSRGEATRVGTKQSGLTAHVRGWDIGARVELSHVDGRDYVRVYATTGSNGGGSDQLIAELATSPEVSA
jgi:hypothetical protein